MATTGTMATIVKEVAIIEDPIILRRQTLAVRITDKKCLSKKKSRKFYDSFFYFTVLSFFLITSVFMK